MTESNQKKHIRNDSVFKGKNKNSSRIVIEILVVIFIIGCIYLVGLLSGRAEIGLLSILAGWFIVWIWLKTQNKRWDYFGFSKPDNWIKTILLVLGWLLFFQVCIGWFVKPWIIRLTGKPLDISEFEILRGNFNALLRGLLVVWTIAAFGEEIVFRGYFLNRITDIFRSRKAGYSLAVLCSSLVFGLGHVYQGISGFILATFAGVLYACAYILSRRNLWVPILIHGFYDTWAFLVLFFGIENKINPFMF